MACPGIAWSVEQMDVSRTVRCGCPLGLKACGHKVLARISGFKEEETEGWGKSALMRRFIRCIPCQCDPIIKCREMRYVHGLSGNLYVRGIVGGKGLHKIKINSITELLEYVLDSTGS